MALPEFSLRQLLEAGVHFGHQTHRWNPRMDQFIYGSRNGIHIMDLTQTVPLLDQALLVVQQTVAKGGSILFVGTKRQAAKAIADAAERSAQYYMNHRWLGGTLTNWKTVSNSIARLKQIDEKLENGADGLTKKERLGMEREQTKLQASLGGIREMGGTPDLIFVIDTNKESLAVAEAKKLGIPVIAVVDSNSAPDGIDYPIPGNDDAARAIGLYCDLIARAALDGMASQMGSAGIDVGALEEAPIEEIVEEAPAAKAAPAEEEAVESAGSKPQLFTEAPADKDDLKKISGVGPKLEETMNKLGIYQFAQVASWSNDEIMWVDDNLSFKGRIERDDWIGQAKELMAG
ncbi:30S ribosomal protein S2 [Amylibacter kogurei]|uniref:Small ribosomal subunit protein uS2 n=1 Tax=Paramylibacter kogurei TaxID=1889778 RepID=A0A2G5K6X3_9RHOB|nr:30S ribosomal protein S2 [Amylibacter kogurei]